MSKKLTPFQRETQIQFCTIFIGMQMALDGLDHPLKVPTKDAKLAIDELKSIIPTLEKFVDSFSIGEIRKTTFFTNLQNKIQYNINKEYPI